MSEVKDFDVYSIGICFASVCSFLSLDEIEKRLNQEYPTNIPSCRWKLSKDKFKDGTANPSPCEKNAKTHKHYLFVC